MKWASAWWGIQIAADDDEDVELLQKLYDSLPKGASKVYDEGKISNKDSDGEGDDVFGFSKKEIESFPLVITFDR